MNITESKGWEIRVSIKTYGRCYRFEAILASGDEIKLNMNIFKLEISQGKQINIWINQIQKQTSKAKLTVESWMRGIFKTIYGSIVVNHASLSVKGEEFCVKAATGLEKSNS